MQKLDKWELRFCLNFLGKVLKQVKDDYSPQVDMSVVQLNGEAMCFGKQNIDTLKKIIKNMKEELWQ